MDINVDVVRAGRVSVVPGWEGEERARCKRKRQRETRTWRARRRSGWAAWNGVRRSGVRTRR